MNGPSNLPSRIFLSYAHIDNERLQPAQKGWVDYFHTALNHELRQRRGDGIHFWRDQRDLKPNDFFDDTILQAVDGSNVFVAVVSPVYLTRDYCLKELQRFVTRPEPEVRQRAVRTMKVLKRRLHPSDKDELPFPLGGRAGFKFYILSDEDRRREVHFWNDAKSQVDPLYEKLYWEVIRQIADEIERHLRTGGGSEAAPEAEAGNGPTVFLAAASFDRSDDYWTLRGEIESVLGARVVPDDADLPSIEDDARAAIAAALEQSVASVHLLGSMPGYTPDGPSGKPIAALQLEMAEAKARRSPSFRRLIWVPPGLRPADARQRSLLEALRTGKGLSETDELVEEPLEHFKSHTIDSLRRIAGGERRQTEKSASSRIVFLLCSADDEKAALALRKPLFEQGIEVRLPEFEGSEVARREAFRHHAATADAALVYYGSGLESWVLGRLDELKDWRTLGRRQPFATLGVLISGPATARKEHFSSHQADLVASALQRPPLEALGDFIARVRQG